MSNSRTQAGVKLRDEEKVKHIPITIVPTEKAEMLRKPEWIKVKLPRTTDRIDHIKKTLRKNKLHSVCAVSYTHLTLPTILRVWISVGGVAVNKKKKRKHKGWKS